MPRPLRIQYAGAIYHLMSRGDRRQSIFSDDEDRRTFLSLLARACEETGWQVHAFVLMGNHFHLGVETPQPNLRVGMQRKGSGLTIDTRQASDILGSPCHDHCASTVQGLSTI